MAYYENRAGSVRVTVRLGNGERRKRTFDTRPEAEAWANAMEAKAALGMVSAIRASGKTVADVFQAYLEHAVPQKDSAKHDTLKLTTWLTDPLARVPLAEVTPQHINDWSARRRQQTYRGKAIKPSTLQRELNSMSAAFAYAIKTLQWMEENPVHAAIKPPKVAPRNRPLLTEDEIRALIIATGYERDAELVTLTARVGLLFLLGLETGMRSGELLRVRRRDFNPKARTVFVSGLEQGGRKNAHSGRLDCSRYVPLTEEALRLLTQLERAAPRGPLVKLAQMNDSQRDAIWRKARRQAGVVDLHFHDAKHEACTRLSKFLDVFELSYAVGTKDIQLLRDTYYQNDASAAAVKLPTKLAIAA